METIPTFARVVPLPENCSALAAVTGMASALESGDPDFPSRLFLHGLAGTGKSCLVTALVEDVCSGPAGLSACVLSANNFPLPWDQDEMMAAAERFGAAIRSDLLVVEDLQHLPGRATEALGQLLDERLPRRLATVLTASAGPAQLTHRGQSWPARLTNRLASGLVVAVQPLQAASRLLLLRELARREGLVVAGGVLPWLAESLTGGRQLQGVLHQIDALQALMRKQLSLDELREHFQAQVEASQPTLERIVRRVSGYYRVEPRQLQSPRRQPGLLMPRQISMYLARQLTRLSLQQIGAYFGGRDHTTVLHACRKIEEVMETDANLAGAIRQLRAELA